MTKHCRRCDRTKPVSEFYRCKARKDGLQGYCKMCQGAFIAAWRVANPGRDHDIEVRAKYGLPAGAFAALSEKQNHGCAICGLPCSSGRRLAVDHRHADGRVRGLLCGKHNRMLGLADDDTVILRAAINYLEELHP